MFDIFDSLDDEINYYTRKSGGKKKKNIPKRSVQYVSAGHTRVTYKNRVLDIHFKQTPAEFKKAQRKRTAYKHNGVTDRQRAVRDRYETVQRHKALARDNYTIEDMRALMRDDRWEEVCGHKRWNYDSNSTVKEFKKYLAHTKRHH